MIGIRSSWGLDVIYGGLGRGRYYSTTTTRPETGITFTLLPLLQRTVHSMHSPSDACRCHALALVNVFLTQIFVATNALPHLQIDSTAEMLDRRRLG